MTLDATTNSNVDTLETPRRETAVLLNRKLHPETDPETLTMFGDDRWNLTPGLFESHAPTVSLNFGSVPDSFRDAVKHYIWQLINHDAPRRLRDTDAARLALRTIVLLHPRFVSFVLWLDSYGIGSFSEVTSADLDRYLSDVVNCQDTPGMKASRLMEVRRFWSYRSRLPEPMRLTTPPLWDGEEPRDLVNATRHSSVNRTPRIQTDTMEMLLMWALRFTETFADDITNAFHEHLDLWRFGAVIDDPQFPPPERRNTEDVRPELIKYLDHLKSTSGSLPGRLDSRGKLDIYWQHFVRLFKTNMDAFRPNKELRVLIEQSGLPISDQLPLATPITAMLDETPWITGPFRYDEIRHMTRLLHTACFIVIAYLSGMRTGEVLNLERGCVFHDGATDLWTIKGRKFKGAADHDGNKIPEGEIRDDPWVIVEQSARAASVLERLHNHRLLFPNFLHPELRRGRASHGRSREGRMPTYLADDIMAFIEWVNNYADSMGRGDEKIPPDSYGRIAPARFRRTLAWHIVRKPRGLVAGAIQYGHLHVQITLGYSGSYDSGFPDEHAFEDWLWRIEQLAEDHQRLQSGEHVSGPAAEAYRQRVSLAHKTFAGRVLRMRSRRATCSPTQGCRFSPEMP
ncbi:hypothetical protein JNN96_38190 [Mycobacterium sp. DSM 3803]|nr:hypothetical protein [Mycobacterium sp. DSM 3803]